MQMDFQTSTVARVTRRDFLALVYDIRRRWPWQLLVDMAHEDFCVVRAAVAIHPHGAGPRIRTRADACRTNAAEHGSSPVCRSPMPGPRSGQRAAAPSRE